MGLKVTETWLTPSWAPPRCKRLHHAVSGDSYAALLLGLLRNFILCYAQTKDSMFSKSFVLSWMPYIMV